MTERCAQQGGRHTLAPEGVGYDNGQDFGLTGTMAEQDQADWQIPLQGNPTDRAFRAQKR
ncbi:hypothetical protein AA0535_1892 [Asaia krungthepensis NRIC 0535]|uniref:Uncharacterized protein n=1 Tax=Asaia krungthepensis NRIC 0535 TaxID=1307925 RepID=A0ABQ0Q3M4_9PROT|nr:hypothetical protein [Asaia krungthepensis]GBQ89819.1 hypothetical protein AA0535_1892 [Asaia krungthepensis NRIC 0535]